MSFATTQTTVPLARPPYPDTAFDLAARASNAAEQITVVDALGLREADLQGSLSRVEAWKVGRLARGLASGWSGEPELTAARPADELERVLTAYRLWQRRSHDWDDVEREVLADLHAVWLPAYVSALERFDPAAAPAADRNVEGRAARRRLLSRVCAPFCQLVARELHTATCAANAAAGRELIGPMFAAAFEGHFIDRFELSVAWAVEADQNVALARRGIGRDDATPEDHHRYFDRTFCDAGAHHDLHMRFPVLARWMATVAQMLCDSGTRLLGRLVRDVGELGRELFDEDILAFTSLDLGKADYHAGGQSVAVVDVTLQSGPASFIYKPRNLASERAMQELLGLVGDATGLSFAPRRILDKHGYGYEERIPEGCTSVATHAEAARFYEELGGFLAVFYVLGGSDLHFENIIVAGGHPFACDCETALQVSPPGHEPAFGTVIDSVYRTGLLEWPAPASEDIARLLSGCSGGASYDLPLPIPRLQEAPGLAVAYETGVRVDQDAPNRIRLDGELVDPRDFEEALSDGFRKVHDWFRQTSTADVLVADLFGDTRPRMVARSTEAYSQLLVSARHPRCLTEPLEVDLVFGRLGEAPHRWDADGRAEAAEARALWQLDVPTFAADATRTELLDDRAEPVGAGLERSPLNCAIDRIRKLSVDDRRRQVGYIRASLSAAEVHSSTLVSTALEYAGLVGDELCRLLEQPTWPVRWTYRADGADSQVVEGTLYYGSAGLALFLAYLDEIQPRERLRRAAHRALTHALSCPPAGLGAFDGVTGQIYVLLHLHRLWGQGELLEAAVERSRQLDAMIAADRAFDVLSGSAGVIPVMLALDAVGGGGLDTAHRCARHLLSHAEPASAGLSWPPEDREVATANMTGFAHGAAGIGWALIALGAATGREDYVDAGRQAFAYERLHFDDEQQDWYDLRTSIAQRLGARRHFGNAWCNGAPGIGLSRLASLVALGGTDDELLRETYFALASTVRNYASTGNDILCHGRSGNAELMLRFARERDEPAFQVEANMHAQAQWRRLASTPEWPRAEEGRQPLTGLMCGIAGIGMHFLRLAHPDRVPSPLLLDPPFPSKLTKEK